MLNKGPGSQTEESNKKNPFDAYEEVSAELKKALALTVEQREHETEAMKKLRKVKQQVYEARLGKSVEQLQKEDMAEIQELANYLNQGIITIDPTTNEKIVIEPEK